MNPPQYNSYKDPSAYIIKKESGYYRYILQAYKPEYDHLMQSGLYQKLTEKNLMIPHKEVLPDAPDPNVYKILFPEQISFQTYPYEWSFLQWRKSILSFLKINEIALQYDMILKDASPFNFCLKGGKAILLDTSSFIFFKENDPWLAYRQFCEEFFGPVALMKYNGASWGRIYMSHVRGLALNFISKQLPARSWFNLSCFLHIHLHGRFSSRNQPHTSSSKLKVFTKEKLLTIFTLISSTVKKWKHPYLFNNYWLSYYNKDIESPLYLEDKKTKINEWLKELNVSTVLDLGANTGLFSFIAAQNAKQVIAMDNDSLCVDEIESTIQKGKISNLYALVSDLTEASPDLGLLNKEYRSLFERVESELVMGLALIHHLCIGKNILLEHVAELFGKLSTRYAIVEFLPKEDEKVRLLFENKKDIFHQYFEDHFKECFALHFKLSEVYKLKDSKRILYLWEKRSNHG